MSERVLETRVKEYFNGKLTEKIAIMPRVGGLERKKTALCHEQGSQFAHFPELDIVNADARTSMISEAWIMFDCVTSTPRMSIPEQYLPAIP
jgi:hypothetical protein